MLIQSLLFRKLLNFSFPVNPWRYTEIIDSREKEQYCCIWPIYLYYTRPYWFGVNIVLRLCRNIVCAICVCIAMVSKETYTLAAVQRAFEWTAWSGRFKREKNAQVIKFEFNQFFSLTTDQVSHSVGFVAHINTTFAKYPTPKYLIRTQRFRLCVYINWTFFFCRFIHNFIGDSTKYHSTKLFH